MHQRNHAPGQLMPVKVMRRHSVSSHFLTGIPGKQCVAIFMIHFLEMERHLPKSLSTEVGTGMEYPGPGRGGGLNLGVSQNLRLEGAERVGWLASPRH